MLPLKFYQLHFQVRKNISTSKRFQKHFRFGQQTLPPGISSLLGGQGPRTSTLGMSRLRGWLSRAPCQSANLSYCPALPTYTSLQTAYRKQGDPCPFPSSLGLGFPSINSLLKPPGLTQAQ